MKTTDVIGFLELPGMDAQISIGGLHQLFQIAEAERVVNRQSADDTETQPLVNETVERMRAVRRGLTVRLTADRTQSSGNAPLVVARRSVFTHHASARCVLQIQCEVRQMR